MKLKILATSLLLTTVGLVMPVQAQPTSADRVLQACSQDRADTLPNPFKDVSPNHWAFKAVMSVYYCGAYTGALPLERVKPFLQQQNRQPQSRDAT